MEQTLPNQANGIARRIEAILFWKAEPLAIKKLATLLGESITMEDVKAGLTDLELALNSRGLTIIQTEDEVTLGTSSDLSPLIEKLTKDELSRDLGKAGLETLSIVLYQGPISRADIDYIRGVNSQFILRALLIRGLVERVDNPKDARSFLYKPTIQLLAHMGVSKISDLPDYELVRSDIELFRNSQSENNPHSTNEASQLENATISP